MLRRAWLAAPESGDTLLNQLQSFAQAAADSESEDINSSSSNSHSATSQQPGAATATAAEKTRGWEQLIHGFKVTRKFLRDCSKYGLDAFTVQTNSQFPTPLPAALDEAARVIVDDNDNWESLCDLHGDEWSTKAIIVGQAVGDAAVYLWLLNNPALLSITRGITEQRGDYTEAIVGRTGGLIYA